MIPTPAGRLVPTDRGHDLVLVREFKAPIEDVWASITEPERLARWYGTWSGPAAPGITIELTLTAEEGSPTSQVHIDACTPPTHLAVSAKDEAGDWHLEVRLTEQNGVTSLEFVHHLGPDVDASDIGPGWEFYLDRLVASRDGATLPDFDDYYPAMKPHFEAQQTSD